MTETPFTYENSSFILTNTDLWSQEIEKAEVTT